MPLPWVARAHEFSIQGRDRATGAVKWMTTAADLVFGAHSQLRALAEVYASNDAEEKFARDFVAAWNQAMNFYRYDLLAQARGRGAARGPAPNHAVVPPPPKGGYPRSGWMVAVSR
jgi:hypothetical protein